MKIYGPYFNKGTGRMYIRLKKDGHRIMMNYARYLIEQHLGRELEKDELVHHINGNKLDDRIENLEIINGTNHAIKHNLLYKKIENLICPFCKETFAIARKDIYRIVGNTKRGHAGPFCSSNCSHKYATSIKWDKIQKLEPSKLEITYYEG